MKLNNKNTPTLLKEKYIDDLLASFSQSTNLTIDLVDPDGNFLSKHPSSLSNDLCKYIIKCNNGDEKCRLCYKKACAHAFNWKQPYFFRCHGGLMVWCVPIILNNQPLGALICGKFIMWKYDEFTLDEFLYFNPDIEDKETLNENIKKLSVICPSKAQSIANMMSICVNYILQFKSFNYNLDNNLVEWKQKIQEEIDKRKNYNLSIYSSYEFYFQKEKKLIQYMRIGNKDKSISLLPDLFANILTISNYDFNIIKMRCVELIALISRALLDGGLDSQIAIVSLDLYHNKISTSSNIEDLFAVINDVTLKLIDMISILSNDKHTSLIRKAKDFIHQNYSKDISVEDIAESILISASYLSTIFKNSVNCTVTEYINKVRIEESIELMRQRELTMQEIAKSIGFSNSSYFTKVFKKYMNVTPIHYRNNFL